MVGLMFASGRSIAGPERELLRCGGDPCAQVASPAAWPGGRLPAGGGAMLELVGGVCLTLEEPPRRVRFVRSLLRLSLPGRGTVLVQEIDLRALARWELDLVPPWERVHRATREGMTLYWTRHERPSMWQGYLVTEALLRHGLALQISVAPGDARARRVYGGLRRCPDEGRGAQGDGGEGGRGAPSATPPSEERFER